MKKIVLGCLLICGAFSLSAQQLNHDQIYGFVNVTFCGDSSSFHLNRSPETWHLYDDTASIFRDSLFSDEDRTCFRQQLNAMITFQWDANKIKGAQPVITPRKWTNSSRRRFWRKLDAQSLTSWSMPVFSKNGEYCFISVAYNGEHNGRGWVRLYKKEAASWMYVKQYSTWRAC